VTRGGGAAVSPGEARPDMAVSGPDARATPVPRRSGLEREVGDPDAVPVRPAEVEGPGAASGPARETRRRWPPSPTRGVGRDPRDPRVRGLPCPDGPSAAAPPSRPAACRFAPSPTAPTAGAAPRPPDGSWTSHARRPGPPADANRLCRAPEDVALLGRADLTGEGGERCHDGVFGAPDAPAAGEMHWAAARSGWPSLGVRGRRLPSRCTPPTAGAVPCPFR
jgi:hypothetical protein